MKVICFLCGVSFVFGYTYMSVQCAGNSGNHLRSIERNGCLSSEVLYLKIVNSAFESVVVALYL
jgi:hypothetical protein